MSIWSRLGPASSSRCGTSALISRKAASSSGMCRRRESLPTKRMYGASATPYLAIARGPRMKARVGGQGRIVDPLAPDLHAEAELERLEDIAARNDDRIPVA